MQPLEHRRNLDQVAELRELTSVDKAIALLKVFGDDAYLGVGVSELSRRAGLSKSTAFRLLGILERNDMIERVGTAYRFGRGVQALVIEPTSRHHDHVRDLLTPFLVDLFVSSQRTVQLAVIDDTDVVYLNKLEIHGRLKSPSRIGGRMPAYCTGVGKALMAFDGSLAERVLQAPRHQWTPGTIADEHAIRVELAGIRRAGLAHDRGESVTGLSCLAAPILDHRGRSVAALSLSGSTDAFDPRQYEFVLRQTALAASRAITRADTRAIA